jgi:TetR/AcrR family transcriptional repressor of mexJK operon
VLEAARTLFLQQGYAGTTMDDIASLAGLTKRTLYNNYPDKEALFVQIVADVTGFADEFVRQLRRERTDGLSAATMPIALEELGSRLAVTAVRAEVVALRRLLIGESRAFPSLGAEYYQRVPGQVIGALAHRFGHLARVGLLQLADSRGAAAQFAYLVAGEHLDRAVLTGTIPPAERIVAAARDGVRTFLARYARPRRPKVKSRSGS